MKALYYPNWNELELRDLDRPEPAAGEVLVRVAACGVCGSEIETFASRSARRTPPLVMGHEFCGVVDAVSDDVDSVPLSRLGTKIVSNSVLHCGSCEACLSGATNICPDRNIFGMHRPGAFAEYVPVPVESLFGWPDAVPATEACLAEPLANGVHVARLIADRRPRLILIIGAGSIGLMCLQAVRNFVDDVACVVTDLDAQRLSVAEQLGAESTALSGRDDLADTLRALGGRAGADIVIDAAGAAATKAKSIAHCRPGGAVVWIGLAENALHLHSYDVTLSERAVLGSYGATAGDIETALELIGTRRVDVSSWVTPYEHDDWVDGFMRQLDPDTRDVKAVLVN